MSNCEIYNFAAPNFFCLLLFTYFPCDYYNRKMTQSILNNCPVSKHCCFSITLKVGTIIIAISGLVPSIILILLYGIASPFLIEHGVPPIAADAIIHIYAVLGILLCGTHLILLAAAITYNEQLILLYLWSGIVYVCVDIVLVILICVLSILANESKFGILILLGQILYWLILYIFVFPIVNGFRRNIHTVVIILYCWVILFLPAICLTRT